jgi:hypothetical protein
MSVVRTIVLAPKVAEDSNLKWDQSSQRTGVNVIKHFPLTLTLRKSKLEYFVDKVPLL